MATVDYTGDYYTYADTATSVQLYNNQMPVTIWGGWTYPNTDAYTPVIPPEVIDDLKKRLYELEETKTKKKVGKNMYTLWKVIILDPETDNFQEYKVTAKEEEIAIFKALYEHMELLENKLADVDRLKIETEEIMTYEKSKKEDVCKEC